ncbi:MAG: TFIIB-type zinc finger domain-containing protein [Mangrovicoccus sp.]
MSQIPPPPPGASEPSGPSVTPQSHRFPCESCGANMRFDPAAGQLVCSHCGNSEEISDRAAGPWANTQAIKELDFRQALAQQLPQADLEETQVLSCPNCGAQVEFDPAVHASECPFCATPVVTSTGTDRHIKPRGLLPFALDEDTARQELTAWLGRLWFAPSGLAKLARKGRRMDGVYVPYWTFDAQTQSQYRGQRGTVYYEHRRRGDKTEMVQKIRWTPVGGRVARFFDDVLVLGARSLPKGFTEALPPWDLSRLEPYAPEYIAGLRAEAYTIELDEAFHEARAYMDRVIERDVRFDIGGDRQRVNDIQTQISGVTFKHILLPIWVAAYKYQGQSYRVVINGQSGRIQGERPYSAWKIALAVAAGLAIAAGLGYFYAVNQGLVSAPLKKF